MPVALDGCQARAFSLCADGKAAARNGFCIGFVNVRHGFFECRGIETVRDDRGPADDILSSGQFFGIVSASDKM